MLSVISSQSSTLSVIFRPPGCFVRKKKESVPALLGKEDFLTLLVNGFQRSHCLFAITTIFYNTFLFHLNAVKSAVRHVSCAFANDRKSYSFLYNSPREISSLLNENNG